MARNVIWWRLTSLASRGVVTSASSVTTYQAIALITSGAVLPEDDKSPKIQLLLQPT